MQPNWLHMPIGYNGRASTVVVVRHADPPAARAAEAAGRGGAEFRPVPQLDFELEIGVVIGQASAMGERLTEAQAEADDLRLRAAERLERARHPAMGIRAARPVPGQGVCDLDQPVDRDARGAGAVPGARPGAGAGAAAVSAQQGANNYDIAARSRPAQRGDERSGHDLRAPTSNTCTGRRCSNWCTTPPAAAP